MTVAMGRISATGAKSVLAALTRQGEHSPPNLFLTWPPQAVRKRLPGRYQFGALPSARPQPTCRDASKRSVPDAMTGDDGVFCLNHRVVVLTSYR